MTRAYGKIMKPWHGKLRECKVSLRVCLQADTMGWLSRPEPLTNEPTQSLALVPYIGVEPVAAMPDIPDLPDASFEPALPAVPAMPVVTAMPAVPAMQQNMLPFRRRRNSTAGGSSFAVDNEILEMGADYMRRMIGSMILNRFDPFQRMRNGPMRSRAKSTDTLEVIHELVGEDAD